VTRAHPAAFGILVPIGIHVVERPIMAAEQADLPAAARRALSLPADPLLATRRRIDDLTADIRADARGPLRPRSACTHEPGQRTNRGIVFPAIARESARSPPARAVAAWPGRLAVADHQPQEARGRPRSPRPTAWRAGPLRR
jgi:transposase